MSRTKFKRLTGLPVSLEELQEESHGSCFHQAFYPFRIKGLTWRFLVNRLLAGPAYWAAAFLWWTG
jgi:hypothetical protein